jgi:urea transport system permease protein
LSFAKLTSSVPLIAPALVGVVPSIEMVIWVAIGGRYSIAGAISGTLLVNFAKDKVSTALPELWLYALGGLFILAVTVLPKGIAGEFAGEREWKPMKLGDMLARWRAARASA